MPVHDWNRVDEGTFHGFHTTWITHLSGALNRGILPPGYYSLPEQHTGRPIADVLTLHAPPGSMPPGVEEGGLAVAEAPPRVSQRLTVSPSLRARRRTLSIRHVSGHQIVALVEVVSPANKDRPQHVNDFVAKALSALNLGIHVATVDLFPPGRHDPQGMHGAVLAGLDEDETPSPPPADRPLTLASFVAGPQVEVYLEHGALGRPLPDMPLFLRPDRYINLPLESTYQTAYADMPQYWRNVLETPTPQD
jgi:hypothetical protein